ncbi:pentapeptide repeat-containing protein [Clostridium sp. SHJSY1]|uniref:pentapeptide repeat-containing protein n=1 Tax=Clostridium sp. SHJSY1 TaxID=2942483 RepID=UPI0028770E4F|nr:pentapeptide repeat-containing protein [Clostridium sp. SHJSY1]MDS0525673.1 pentapeptide repeat-containing protein [Clostridium sp. SHJSY1]
MIYKNEENLYSKIYDCLKINCQKCFGFCCVALYFSASEGFPTDKAAGNPCINLEPDFSCTIHKNLSEKGLKGCTAYDCFGAGQKVAQVIYNGQNWRQNPELSKEMFQVFLIVRQIHEMIWYLSQAFIIEKNDSTKEKLMKLIREMESITYLKSNKIINLDIELYRDKVNPFLKKASEFVRSKVYNGQRNTLKHRKTIAGRLDLIGKDLRKINLRGADLRGSLLMAADLRGNDLSGADFIGADLRDADFRGANLSRSIFITQNQINSTKGDSNTKLPKELSRPTDWDK